MSGSDYEETLDEEEEEDEQEEHTLEDQLIEAAGAGRLIEVDRLIAEGVVDVDGTGTREDNSRALHLSAQNGRPLVTNSLIRAGADVNATNDGGDTPLILASLNGHGSIVDALLKSGANVHATDQFGSCALFYDPDKVTAASSTPSSRRARTSTAPASPPSSSRRGSATPRRSLSSSRRAPTSLPLTTTATPRCIDARVGDDARSGVRG